MLNINAKKKKDFIFEMDLKNTDSKPKCKFTLETDNHSISFPCIIDENKIIAKIPKLEEHLILIEDVYNAKLEVIIDNQYFELKQGKIKIEKPVNIEITETNEIEKENNEIIATLLEEDEIDDIDDINEIEHDSEVIEPHSDILKHLSLKDKLKETIKIL